jgi:predicted nucleotidyltransferase
MERTGRPPAHFLEAVVSEVRRVLAGELVGLYLYGSSVSGGFDEGISDIDLVGVTSSEVQTIDLAGLDQMHQDFVSRHPEWRDRLEIVYIGRATLRSFRASSGHLAVISPGEPFHVVGGVADWLQNWYLVRETGITLFGADAAQIFPPVTWAEFVAATVRYADEVRGWSRIEAGSGPVAYAILTMCRALYTVRNGAQSSKQVAAAWTRERKPDWAWLIDAAMDARGSRGRKGFANEGSRAAAEMFIGLIADEISGDARS